MRSLSILFLAISLSWTSPASAISCQGLLRFLGLFRFNRGPLKIALVGDPVLRHVAEPVPESEISTPEFQGFLDDLVLTMERAGGVGIAAPQVFVSKRVFVMVSGGKATLVINPKLTVMEEKPKSYLEGCLSIPWLCGFVRRPRKMMMEYTDREGRPQILIAEGLDAVVIQHEYDHLDGILFPDRFRFLRLLPRPEG